MRGQVDFIDILTGDLEVSKYRDYASVVHNALKNSIGERKSYRNKVLNESVNKSINRDAIKINRAFIYFLQINNSSNWRWRSEADFVEEFVDDSNAFLYFRYLTRV